MEEYIFNLSGEEIQERLDAVPNKADKDNVYTKTETDAKLAGKADKADVYTKTETDTKLANKADKNSVYTKTETDAKLASKADKADVYTKTETDTKLANKADKNSVYTKTETDTLFEVVDRVVANKADKASTLAGYGIGDAYTKRNVDALLTNKAGTDVYRQIADVDADRRAAPFGKIISEQIDTEEESYGGDILEDQICYSTVLSTFVYKEFGTTKYYANWSTKKHYIGADGYPYFGKQFYCHDEDKMYVFDGMKLKAVQIPAVVSFSEPWDADIDITMGSVADEREYPEYKVVFSTVRNRFVYKADDGKFYDNWSTRHLYIDQTRENNKPRRDVMYFALDLGNLYIYDFELSDTLKLINEDLSGFLDKKDHALTEFITAGREATVVDYASIFNGAAGEISKMHWMYFIHIQQKVVGFMDVQVSYAGNASKIRITERLRTRALLSEDKKSINWQPTLEWNEDHEYTRFILSYDDMSQDIKAGEWTAWYEVPKAGLMPAYVDGVFDVNRYVGSDTPYDSLSQVLNNAATLIPTTVRRGGMSIKFVQSSNNKYVQFRLTATSFSIHESNWEKSNTIKGISNAPADSEDEILTFTDDEDNEFARISEEESNFTNLKSNGKEVLTSDDKDDIDASIENLSDSVDGVERKTENIDNEETESREQAVIFTDNEDNEFARIDENGVKAKDFFDENGDSIKSTSGYNTIPKIYKEEILQINNQNRSPSSGQTVGDVPLVLLQFSDLHGDSDSLRRIVDFYDYYKGNINDAIHLGDIIYDQWSHDFNFWSECGADDILNCIGNHDDNVVGGTAKTEAECYERYFQPFIDDWGVVSQGTGKCSYYKDYANQKIRLIVMDIMPVVRNESNNVSWLESVLNDVLTNHQDYSVILANHYPIPFSGSTKIANAFNSPYSSPGYGGGNCAVYVSAIDTFISNGGKFICHINGHTHFDTTLYLAGNHNQWELNINCATHQQTMWNDGDRSGHTNNQDCFNIIGFDTYNKLVKVIRVGCKYDRYMNKKNIMVIHYDETGETAPEVVTYY